LTLSGTPAPACRRNISTTALLGVPNTWMYVVASTVSAYAFAARSATTPEMVSPSPRDPELEVNSRGIQLADALDCRERNREVLDREAGRVENRHVAVGRPALGSTD